MDVELMSAASQRIEDVLRHARSNDAAAAANATRALTDRKLQPAAVHIVLEAALNLNDPRFIEAAARLTIVVDLPVPARIRAARRLATAGRPVEAISTLLSDPAVLANGQWLPAALGVLSIIASGAGPGATTDQAGALMRRMLPIVDMARMPSEHSFAGEDGTGPRLRGPPVAWDASPGLPEAIVGETTATLAAFDRAAQNAKWPVVTVIPDVFVNRIGQVWRRDGCLVRPYGIQPLSAASRNAEATARVLDEAAMAVDTHNNMFHWLAEWMPTLAWLLDSPDSEMPILIRDNVDVFVRASLQLAAVRPPIIEEVGDAVFVRRLHVVQRGMPNLVHQRAAGPMLERLRQSALGRCVTKRAEGRPLYISRRDSRRRPLLNEQNLEEALARRGFDIVLMSDLPFSEKVARVNESGLIVAPHGAGLALLAAARPGRHVLEIVPALRGAMQLRTCMAKMSRILGHSHRVWLQDMPPPGEEWSVALDPLLSLLDSIPHATA